MSNYDERESANDDSTITTIYPKDSSYLSFFLLIVPVFGFIGLLPILVIISGPGIPLGSVVFMLFPSAVVLLTLIYVYRTLFFTKVQYHETFIQFKGFTHTLFPHKNITNINYSDIVEAYTFKQSVGLYTTFWLLIKKIDGTTIKFDTSIFNRNEVLILLHQHMVNQLSNNPVNELHTFSINIENEPGSFWTGRYRKLEIYINNTDKLNIVTSNITLHIHIGDILTLIENNRAHIFRIEDYPRATYKIQET